MKVTAILTLILSSFLVGCINPPPPPPCEANQANQGNSGYTYQHASYGDQSNIPCNKPVRINTI